MDFSNLGQMLSGAGSKFTDFIANNPEQFAIMADAVGQNMAPGNAFAGVGSAMGKSSLANKAMQHQQQQQQDWRQLISGMLSGQVPTTAAGTPGLTSATIKPSKEGGSNELSLSITEPTDMGNAGQQSFQSPAITPKNYSMGDLMSYPF